MFTLNVYSVYVNRQQRTFEEAVDGEGPVDVEGDTDGGQQDDQDVQDVPHGLEVRAPVLLDLHT